MSLAQLMIPLAPAAPTPSPSVNPKPIVRVSPSAVRNDSVSLPVFLAMSRFCNHPRGSEDTGLQQVEARHPSEDGETFER